jgi:hypothetical protein
MVAMALAGSLEGLAAQEIPTPLAVDRGDWEFAVQMGLTSFGVDLSSPGTMTTVGIARNVTARFSVGVEGGLGSIESVHLCDLGGTSLYECAGQSTWPTLGLNARFTVFDLANSAARQYVLVQFVGHGPDLVASYDLGLGTSFRTVLGGDVGIELRHRFGYDGASGGMYFFRISH